VAKATPARTRNLVADELDRLVESHAYRRGVSKGAALSEILRDRTSSVAKQYRALRAEHDALPQEAPPAPYVEAVVTKSPAQLKLEEAWEQLLGELMKARNIGRGEAARLALQSEQGRAIYQRLDAAGIERLRAQRGMQP
jgi:hypothetical protein